ncbi:ABC-2 type transport system ATP-binding protein [Dyadobacter koreensis]|uniref:ABC-2 type transport system ATP-binding protein n=1 Tax=Dyadobacter koreensis TaxID=408657 RepID=A0A1H6SYL1_9BACT|nr:ABC transporter ATP-binding protein [Dyadobacter koreensis]SEI72881.1 ABC-2 type transport system ATP-binding protein [Dyadobacter koreensis]
MYKGPSIQIENITKRYKSAEEDSLSLVSLQINESDVYGLLGPNGAGKTTLISILCGIIPPSQGSIQYYIAGKKINEQERRSLLGFVPQEYAFYQELTPRQNLDYFGAMYNLSKTELSERIDKLLDELGLAKVADKEVFTFSGGMKRRVNLAIGLIHRPSILFLDEPTVGVDVQSKNAIIKYLEEINRAGTTIVYTSHHMSEAEEFCNRIALIDHGKVVVEGGLSELLIENGAANLQSLFIKLTGEEYRD